MEESYEAVKTQALDALVGEEPRVAFRRFRSALDYPGLLDSTARWTDAMEVFARIAQAIAGDRFAGLVRHAAREPDDVRLLYELGYELIDQGLHGIAATVLARAQERAPADERVLTELVWALEKDGRHEEACRYLLANPDLQERSFLCRYLLAFNRLMTGDLEEPRKLLPSLRSSEEFDHVQMTRSVEGMIARADAVRAVTPLDRHDLRGWHLVITGSFLLHLSPYGANEGMNGRYAYTQDSEANCREAIERMRTTLGTLALAPPRVYALADRASQILADATAHALGLPVEPWPEGGTSAPGLVVAYDLGGQENVVLHTLRNHQPGQLLWSHASCWTQDHPFAPDFLTFLYQFNTSPWDSHLAVDPETREVRQLPAVEGTVESLARRIGSAEWDPATLQDLDDLQALARTARTIAPEHAPGALRNSEKRRRQWNESPVRSNRFM